MLSLDAKFQQQMVSLFVTKLLAGSHLLMQTVLSTLHMVGYVSTTNVRMTRNALTEIRMTVMAVPLPARLNKGTARPQTVSFSLLAKITRLL